MKIFIVGLILFAILGVWAYLTGGLSKFTTLPIKGGTMFFGNVPYPSELLALKPSDKIATTCTKFEAITYNQKTNKVILNNAQLSVKASFVKLTNLIAQINFGGQPELVTGTIVVCSAQDSTLDFGYITLGPKIFTYAMSSTTQLISDALNLAGASSCALPVAFTKNRDFYLTCTQDNGNTATLLKLTLGIKKPKELLKCSKYATTEADEYSCTDGYRYADQKTKLLPTDWYVSKDKDLNGTCRIRIQNITNRKAVFSNRSLPEIYITKTSPYDVAGSICANQTCTETKKLKLKSNSYNIETSVIEASKMLNGVNQLDYYGFVADPHSKDDIFIYTSYETDAQEEEIVSILSSAESNAITLYEKCK